MRLEPGTIVHAYGDEKPVSAWPSDPRCTVPREAFYKRMAAVWPAERALSERSHKTRTFEAFGHRKTLAQWAKDPRCRVPVGTVRDRLGRG